MHEETYPEGRRRNHLQTADSDARFLAHHRIILHVCAGEESVLLENIRHKPFAAEIATSSLRAIRQTAKQPKLGHGSDGSSGKAWWESRVRLPHLHDSMPPDVRRLPDRTREAFGSSDHRTLDFLPWRTIRPRPASAFCAHESCLRL